jgi:hypothetical protein
LGQSRLCKWLRHSFFGRLLSIAAVLYLAGTVFGGIGLGWIALHPPRLLVAAREEANARDIAKAASDGFESISPASSDGTTLRAWF